MKSVTFGNVGEFLDDSDLYGFFESCKFKCSFVDLSALFCIDKDLDKPGSRQILILADYMYYSNNVA